MFVNFMADITKGKEEYCKLQEKYDLPKFSELEKYFTFTELNSAIILIEVRRKIHGVFEHFANYLEGLIQPDSNYSSMYEANVFDDIDKKKCMEVFRRFMYYIREGDRISILKSDIEEVKYIKSTFKVWKENREILVLFSEKLRDSWNGESILEKEQEYFG